MSDLDLVAARAADALQMLLSRLATLTFGLMGLAAGIGAATYATGLWVSHGTVWPVLGALVCGLPASAGALAWWRVRRTQVHAPAALRDLRALIRDRRSRSAVSVLIDVDSRQPVLTTVRSLAGLRADLEARGADWAALTQTLRAATTVPGLAALTIVGMLLVGGLGTMMLLIGLLR
jgi:hypothetical protein